MVDEVEVEVDWLPSLPAGVETEDVDCAPSAAANTLVSAAVDVTADPVIAVVDVCGY